MPAPTGAGIWARSTCASTGAAPPLARGHHEGEVLESLVPEERDKATALKFIKKALRIPASPKAITTDGLRCHGAAMKGPPRVRRAVCVLLGRETRRPTQVNPLFAPPAWARGGAASSARRRRPAQLAEHPQS